MAPRRKTIAERRRERANAERQAWEVFREKLGAAATLADACSLFLQQAPPEGTPGRRYYSNLGFFLQGLSIPGGASAEELGMYAALLDRLGLEPEVAAGLRRAARSRL